MTKTKKPKYENIHGKPEISSGHDIAVTSSKWFGALFFYVLNLGKVPLKQLWTKKYSMRNLWVGYLMKLSFLALILFLVWNYYLRDTV